MKARLATAASGPSVTFPVSTFPLTSTSATRSTPRAAYSSSASAFYTVFVEGSPGELVGVRVTPAGVVSPPDVLTATGADDIRPEIAWNSLTNEMLIVSTITTPSSFEVRAQRFSMGSPPPAAPTGLAATAGVQQVSLTWNSSAGATSYNVKRASISAGPYTTVAFGLGVTSYLDTGLTAGVPYFYVVSAQNSDGEGGNSTEVMVVPLPPPPAAPTGLAAIAGDQQVSLSWSASSGAASYTLKRSTSTGGPYALVTTLASFSYVDVGLSNGTTYYYVVSATNAGGDSPDSTEVSATPLPPPPAPTNLTVTLSGGSAVLNWTGSAGATGYTVRRSTSPGGPFTAIATGIAGTTYTDATVVAGTTYYYTVSASNSAGESAASGVGSVTPGFLPVAVFIADKNTPGVPELFVADEAGTTVVNLSGSLVPGGQVFRSPAPFSPDGSKVAFIAEKDTVGTRELYVVPSAGGTAVKVSAPLGSGGNVLDFRWSPDGGKVGYSAAQDSTGVLELFVAESNGSATVKVSGAMAPGNVGLGQFAWAPDGSRVAYSAYQDSASALEVYTSLPDGTGNVKVSGTLTPGGTVSDFTWTRSGTRLLYQASQDSAGLFELFTVLPDGTGKVKISGSIAPGGAVQSFTPR
jgi:Tol biopolymer transport system component/fibronectin type 3 domain-containing protein